MLPIVPRASSGIRMGHALEFLKPREKALLRICRLHLWERFKSTLSRD